MIQIAAAGLLDALRTELIFVGGAVSSLYVEDPVSRLVRPTMDVDCIVQISTRKEYSKLEEALRKKGFRHCVDKGAPTCRWTFEDILIDIMPCEPKILGFSNKWFTKGLDHCKTATLPNGTQISILSLPYYIASKIEAYHGRDEKDFRLSHDIEDIIFVLDGISGFDEFFLSPVNVRKYLAEQFGAFVKDSCFIESISANIEFEQKSPARVERIIDFAKRLQNLFC
jgi:hypothetical protein